jgi:aryl-alcohol dehydrogenase-like predicted oxidoreductase
MKLALGTVQFGLKYGIANVVGQVPFNQMSSILNEARQAGIDTLDTAISYGDCEARLGELGIKNWNVITKIPALPKSLDYIEDWVLQQVHDSLQRIGVEQLDGLLLHQPSDILGPQGAIYVRTLEKIRDDGLVRSIGYSIYSPDELQILLPVFMPDIVQAPLNVIDRRLITSGWSQRLYDNGVRIHTRSAFLQGLLVMCDESRPSWFDRWQPFWQAWTDACTQSAVSPLELALGFVLAQPSVERVVVGVDTLRQMTEIINAARKSVTGEFPQIESQDRELIEPFRWKLS